jgi:hypothetical protein
MVPLIRMYGLFYLTATGTFFLLCAYGLVAEAPNFPYLPALFLPVYLAGAVAMSERETGDPMLGILPVTPALIVRVKFGLALGFVAIALVNMTIFTAIQYLGGELTLRVMKLNILGAMNTLILGALFQAGFHFFGHSTFHKVIIGFTAVGGFFTILFFVAVAESGRRHPDLFPLAPMLDSLPLGLVLATVPVALWVFYLILRRGPWNASFTAGMSTS